MCIGLCGFVILMCIPSSLPFLVLPLVLLIIAVLQRVVSSNAIFGNRAAVFLGEISFSIYLVHPPDGEA